MAQGLAINIGLNRVDPAAYHGWDGQLKACEADAEDMHALAAAAGIEGDLILTEEATADRVIAAIADAAGRLEDGDLLFLTNSSHGGQVPDVTGEEDDAQDETWVMFDRQIVDDELYGLWATFADGVRIFVLSDSCHSGSVTRAFYEEALIPQVVERFGVDADATRVKAVPPGLRQVIYEEHKAVYDAVQEANPKGETVDIGAHVLLISGCADNQESLDGARNGLFTSKLLEVWDDGAFKGSHRRLHREIAARMPPTQSPQLFLTGAASPGFVRQRPLKV
jgi:hypothetical protein